MAAPRAKKGWVAAAIVLLVLVVDQVIKIEVKTGMRLHESLRVTDWFYIYFIENEGMAYGMTFVNKLVLTLFRILVVSVIAVYLHRQVRADARWGYVVCLALVIAGAGGNIIDCVAYGQVFTASTPYALAHFVPWGEGYAPVFYGRVVDMFYFPIIETDLPQWLPIWGGQHFIFFSPVFNFADACISCGVVALLLFYRSELGEITFGTGQRDGDGTADHGDGDTSHPTSTTDA